jgi:peptide/nickel transport system ATP-binding protein
VSVLYISHNIALLSELTNRLVIMYAGQIVEEGLTTELTEKPRHPYTAGLIAAVPRRAGGAVRGIPGLPPVETDGKACAFSARCNFAIAECSAGPIALAPIMSNRKVRCIRANEVNVYQSLKSGQLPKRSAPTHPCRISIADVHVAHRGPGRSLVHALRGVSLGAAAGEAVGIVGESGSGKSTLLRVVAGLTTAQRGEVLLDGIRLAPTVKQRTREQLRAIQIVFQDPDRSLNPRLTAGQSIEAALRRLCPDLSRAARIEQVHVLTRLVQLDERLLARYPHQLSGGQKQRIAIARALAGRPRVLLCDEVVSALDVSVQASILNLLRTIVETQGCSLLLVGHDLAAVRVVTDRIVVVRNGLVCEAGSADSILDHPKDIYTRELVSAIPGMF